MSQPSYTVSSKVQQFLEILFSILAAIISLYLVSIIIEICFSSSNKYDLNGNPTPHYLNKSFYGGIIVITVSLAALLFSSLNLIKIRVLDYSLLFSGAFLTVYGLDLFSQYGDQHKIIKLLVLIIALFSLLIISYLKFSKRANIYSLNSSVESTLESPASENSVLSERVAKIEKKLDKVSLLLSSDEEKGRESR